MDSIEMLRSRLTRRAALGVLTGISASVLMSACRYSGDDDDDGAEADDLDDDTESAIDDDSDSPEPDQNNDDPDSTDAGVDDSSGEDLDDDFDDDSTNGDRGGDPDANVIAGDVLEYDLEPNGRWDGPFGSVTFHLHQGWVDGDDLTFIRVDASDQAFAEQEGLVHAPLLRNALDIPGSCGDLYLIQEGPPGQRPVLSNSPADAESFSPAFQVHHVLIVGKTGIPLSSEQEILAAADNGDVEIDSTDIVVNYPVISWPGGQLEVDDERVESLGNGQLLEPPDVDAGRVTFKLHPGFPGNRFIITDASLPEVAQQMGVGTSGATHLLEDAGPLSSISVFLNGIGGAGLAGYQPAVFSSEAGESEWSPFCEHFSVEWVDDGAAEETTSEAQLDDLIQSGDLVRYSGDPDLDPEGFVVNCPVPILAPVSPASDD